MNKKLLVFTISALLVGKYINTMHNEQRIVLREINPKACNSLKKYASKRLPALSKKIIAHGKKLQESNSQSAFIDSQEEDVDQIGDFESLLQETKGVFKSLPKYKKTLEELAAIRTPKVIADTIEQIEQVKKQLESKKIIPRNIAYYIPPQSEKMHDKLIRKKLIQFIDCIKQLIEQTIEETDIKLFIVNLLQDKQSINTTGMLPQNKEIYHECEKPKGRLQYVEDLLNSLKQDLFNADINNYDSINTLCTLLLDDIADGFERMQKASTGSIKTMRQITRKSELIAMQQKSEKMLASANSLIIARKNHIAQIKVLLDTIHRYDDPDKVGLTIERIKTKLNEKEQYITTAQKIIQKTVSDSIQKIEEQQSPQQGSCNVCQKVATNQCAKCKQVFYCSREHQKQDWKDHKQQCGQPAQPEKQFKVMHQNNTFTVIDTLGTLYNVLDDTLTIQDNNGVTYKLHFKGNKLNYQNTETQQCHLVLLDEKAKMLIAANKAV